MTPGITEKEVAAELVAKLNQFIQQGGTPFDRATVEHHAGSGYPDITIWTDYAAQKAFAFWELKAPGLKEDLSKLPAKAQSLGVRHVVVWNFRHGELYEVEKGQLVSRKSYPIPLLNTLSEWSVVPKRIAVIDQARKMLDDLVRLYQGQSLMPYVPDKFYFIGILGRAIHDLVPVLQEHIFQQKKNHQVRGQIGAWATAQGYPVALPDLDTLLARHWAYSLAVRILFYFTVRRYRPGLPDLQPAPGGSQSIADLLKDAFSQAVDWQAVFELSPLDRLGLPSEAEPILDDLLEDFHRYDLGLLKEDVIGQIMEGLIPEEERHALGQYFTREDLVDLIIGFVAGSEEANYLDPTCGSGTFLNRLYSRLRWLSTYHLAHAQLLERLWGVDIAHFPAELATINLFRQDVQDLGNFPRIVVRDFFGIRPGELFHFPPLQAAGDKYAKIEVAMPDFAGIVGNFPYIRQELIERQIKGYKKKIVLAVAREWFWEDQDLFEVKGIPAQDIAQVRQKPSDEQEKWLQDQVDKGRIDLRLSGQADIYAYLFFHAAAFLQEGGRIGIVTSNAWLDVAYGVELKRFFLRHFKIVAVVASWCEPWFEDAAINTAFVILERCAEPEKRAQNIVRFVKVKKPLADLLPRDLLLQEPERWKKVDALVGQIETADAQIATWDQATGQIQPLHGVHTLEADAFRIRLVPQAELEAELEAKGETAKWGLYIRAPQVYFDLLQAAGGKLVPLSQVAEVRRGYTTGINDFFYLEPYGTANTPGAVRVKNARGWIGEIEQACLRPVIKSPKEAQGLVIDPAKLKYYLFLPPIDAAVADPEGELQKAYPLAHAYVEWGAQQRTPQGQPWPNVPSVQRRKTWWLLPDRKAGSILMPMVNDRRFAIFQNKDACVDHNLFEFLVPTKDGELSVALMNSTLFALMREVVSRVNLGDGATKTEGIDWENSVLMVLPRILDGKARRRILRAYDGLKGRLVKPIAEEVKQGDRQALDRAVLAALGLDPKVYLQPIYQGLVEMVEERLALPKMRATRKKHAKRRSLEQVKDQVRQEILPGGLKSISAFLPAGGATMMDVALAGRPVSWRPFINEFDLLDADGKEVGKLKGTEHQARYAVYAAVAGQYMVKVPADSIVAGQTVQHYEQYLRQTAQRLQKRALEATHDHRQAECIVREILRSLGLPPLAVSVAME